MTKTNGTYQWVSIPKTATRTIHGLLRPQDGWKSLGDHAVFDEAAGGQCVAAIRDPYDRLASACSFSGISTYKDLVKTIDHYDAWQGYFPENRFWCPQYSFVGHSKEPILFPFEEVSSMITLLGHKSNVPVTNKKQHRLTASKIKEELSYLVEDRYFEDFRMRERLI